MNSESLQKQFPEVYRDFFSKNDLVVSGCFSFPWGPRSLKNTSNKFILKSCLPLRCYIGLKATKDSKIKFDSAVIFSGANSNFETHNPHAIVKYIDDIVPQLQSFLKDRNIEHGYTISLLSEVEKGHAFGFSGTFPAIISSAFHLLTKEVTTELIHNQEKFFVSESNDKIFRFAWKLELLLRKGRSFGQTAMHTLYGKSTPALYDVDILKHEISQVEVDSINISFIPFDTIISESHARFEIPLDYAILYSGIPSEAFRLEHSQDADIENINLVSDFMSEKIFPHIGKQKTRFQELLEKNRPYDLFSEFMGILNSRTIEYFYNLFLHGYKNDGVEKFLAHMNHLRNFLSIVESQSDFAEKVITVFHANKHHSDECIGIFPLYSGKLGGSYLVGMKPGISRDTFRDVCNELQKNYPQFVVDYFSPLDGEATSGIRVEQNIDGNQYSSFIPKNQVRCERNDNTSFLLDYKDIFIQNPEGILFDTISRKVYYDGKKLTSDDIPSQGTIVDIMSILMSKIGEDVSNHEFPISSYTKNKNEMVGKVIIPIIRYLEKRTNLSLPLICKGELANFYLKLNQTPIPIAIVRKI